MSTTLLEDLMGWRLQQQHKHDLGETHAIDSINMLSNYELLELISEYIEDNLEQKGDSKRGY